MILFFQKHSLWQWGIAGLLLGVGFVWPWLWVGGLIGVALCIHLALTAHTLKPVVFGSLLAWTIKSALALIWVWSVYPIEWLSFDLGSLQLVIIFFYWLTAALWLGLGGVFFALVFLVLKRFGTRTLLFITAPALWVLSEIVGSLIFSIITNGAGGTITSAFSFGFIGYLLAQHSLLVYFAKVYGVYSLGVVLVALATVFVWLIKSAKYQKKYILIGLLFLYGTGFIPVSFEDDRTDEFFDVVVIDTQFPPSYIRTVAGVEVVRAETQRAVDEALKLQPDYIILPEDTRYFDQRLSPNQILSLFRFQKQNPEVIIVDTGRVNFNEKSVLQSFVYNGKENTFDRSQKRYLVPQGEFMPYVYKWALTLFGYGELVARLEKDMSYVVGPNTTQADFADSSPGVLFCFESVSPWGVQKILAERGEVPFIAHPVSHAWFNKPTILWKNLNTMLRVQAIWSDQYIVSAGGHVEGIVISPSGNIEPLENITNGDQWTVKRAFIPKR